MAIWEPPELETDPDAVTVRILQGLAERMPGWAPVEGAPEVALAEELGREIAEASSLVQQYATTAVAGIGQTVFDIAPNTGTRARFDAVVISGRRNGTLPAGFTVVGNNAVGEEIAFALEEPVTLTASGPGSTAYAPMVALNVGTAGNGVGPDPGIPDPDDYRLRMVTATDVAFFIATTAPSYGGTDPETLEQYLARLQEWFSVLHPAGVLGGDLATLLRVLVPGVQRAVAIDGWDAVDQTDNHERTVTVWAIDADGNPLTGAVRAAARAVLEEHREINLNLYLDDPLYHPIEVYFSGTALPGHDSSTVREAVITALVNHLKPGRWGSIPGQPTTWRTGSKVGYLDALRAAGSAAGLAGLNVFTLNGGTSDVTLPGPVGLPAPYGFSGATTRIDGRVS